MRRTSLSRKIFVVCNTTFLIIMALLCILPLVNLFAISLSGKAAANSGAVTFWPVDFTLMAYEKTFNNNNFIRSILISVARTALGTFVSMFVITTAGYALSKDFRGRTPLMWFFVFTMLFGGGLIPSYLVNTSLGLKNNFLVYIIPGAFSCYNLILIMNFFKSIPKALEEAALMGQAFLRYCGGFSFRFPRPGLPLWPCLSWWGTGMSGSQVSSICRIPKTIRWLPSCR